MTLVAGTTRLPHAAPYAADSLAATLGNGTIHSFVTLDSAGRPSAVGATFTAGMLENLPGSNAPLTLWFGPAQSKTPFTHLYFDWVPTGHAPGGVYDRPHFDFHFYFSSLQERLAVAGGPDSMPPPPTALPVGYAKVTESVAFMGTHFGDTSGAEFHGAPFEKTFLYGSHEGKITFYDFMMTTAWLATRPNIVFTIKQPASYPTPGYYPTQARVSYDSATMTYRVAIERFVSR
jgi:hypothetical protein